MTNTENLSYGCKFKESRSGCIRWVIPFWLWHWGIVVNFGPFSSVNFAETSVFNHQYVTWAEEQGMFWLRSRVGQHVTLSGMLDPEEEDEEERRGVR